MLTAGALAAGLAGCSSSTFGLTPQPDGNIVVSNSVTGATLTTTYANPFLVSSGSFSLGIYENHFGGPYTVTVTQWTANFNLPCFVPHYVSTAEQTNVVQFTSDNGAPPTDPTEPNPCINGDEETAIISDSKGHSVNFYYELTTGVPQEAKFRNLKIN
jgi:hypothetical protein